jgi:hypothetical protein
MIILSSGGHRVTNIKGRTNAYWLKDVEVGDIINIVMPLKKPGRTSRGGAYATYVTFFNLTQKTKREYSLNTMDTVFHILELESI